MRICFFSQCIWWNWNIIMIIQLIFQSSSRSFIYSPSFSKISSSASKPCFGSSWNFISQLWRFYRSYFPSYFSSKISSYFSLSKILSLSWYHAAEGKCSVGGNSGSNASRKVCSVKIGMILWSSGQDVSRQGLALTSMR